MLKTLTQADIDTLQQTLKLTGCRPAVEGRTEIVESRDFPGGSSLRFVIDGSQDDGNKARQALFENMINQRPSDYRNEVKTGKITSESFTNQIDGFAVSEIALADEGGVWKTA